ncbi:Zinc finger, CCHC-type superfamily [Sesbania bispinosa]|nr:Zinc finger, CCHC-type superfamily [Sesbania bispinosa]
MSNSLTPTPPSTSMMQSIVPVSVKLDDDNFLVWKMQALGTIKSFKLQKYIDLQNDGGRPRAIQKLEEQELLNVQANYVQYQGNFRGRNQGIFRGRGTNNYRGRNQANFRGRSTGRSQGRGIDRHYNRTVCQVCNKPGHIAINCYHRFNPSYQETPMNQPSTYPDKQHRAMITENFLEEQSGMSALMTVPETFYDPSWYPDTGATNHITFDSNILMGKSSYNGDSKLKMANGESSSIKNIALV